MAFPVSTPTKANLDQSTDSPASARSELVTLVDLVTQIIQSYAQASGICELDGTGKVPASRIPSSGGSGIDADLLDGQHGSYYQNASNLNAGALPAARFNDTAHGSRSGGSLHSPVSTSLNGFMIAADKTKLNAMSITTPGGAVVIDNNLDFAISHSGSVSVPGGDMESGAPGSVDILLDSNATTHRFYVASWHRAGSNADDISAEIVYVNNDRYLRLYNSGSIALTVQYSVLRVM